MGKGGGKGAGSKKKGSKKGKGKKGKGPALDAPYGDWVQHMNNDFKTKNEITFNESIVTDCIDASDQENIRDYLWQYPENPDPDDEEIKYHQDKVQNVLYKKVVVYYFAGLRQDTVEGENITEMLLEAYDLAKTAGRHFEIVYVSWDKKKEHFDEYFEAMPWYALPWNDKKVNYLNLQYKVKEVPRLVVVGQDGHVAVEDAVKNLRKNPQQLPFCKAVTDNVVTLAGRRPNNNPCTVEDCKCKKFLGSKLNEETMPDGTVMRLPVGCNDCGHADIYHIPERLPPEDKKKAAAKGGKKK